VFLAASDHPLERLSFREGDRLIDAQQQPGGAPATLNRRVSALTHVFDCRNDHQLVGAPPVKPRHGWRRRRALPRALSTAPLAPLLAHIPPPMDTALLRLMWRGGWRGSEVAQLQRQDIDWSPPAGLVEQGKGCTERRV
jgi:site-specific recombinase XerC